MDAKTWMTSLIIMFAVRPMCVQDSIFKMSSESSDVWLFSFADNANLRQHPNWIGKYFFHFLIHIWQPWSTTGMFISCGWKLFYLCQTLLNKEKRRHQISSMLYLPVISIELPTSSKRPITSLKQNKIPHQIFRNKYQNKMDCHIEKCTALHLTAGIILCIHVHPANERHYIVTSSDWLGAHTKWSLQGWF